MTSDDEIDPKPFDQFEADSAASTERWIDNLGLEGDEAERFRDHARHWILIDGEPVAVPLLEWGKWMQEPSRRIIHQDDVQAPDGQTYQVSTVFLGLDHSFGMAGGTLLFETMLFRRHKLRAEWWQIFGRHKLSDRESVDDFQWRYHSTAEAEAGHSLAMELVRQGDWDRDWQDDDA